MKVFEPLASPLWQRYPRANGGPEQTQRPLSVLRLTHRVCGEVNKYALGQPRKTERRHAVMLQTSAVGRTRDK